MQLLEQLLVVEDRADVLEMLCDCLKEEGFAPFPARRKSEALEHFSMNPEIRLVITDVRLTDGNGLDLISELSRLRPETRFLVLTGNSDVDLPLARAKGAHGLLIKPASFEDILSALRQIGS
jgi:two-component system response regulator RegA